MLRATLKYFCTATLGLEKFLDGAWGGVKEQEFDWSNVAPDECIICFEPMRSERTTLECNHIFDTAVSKTCAMYLNENLLIGLFTCPHNVQKITFLNDE